MAKKNVYSLETKLKAIELRESGKSVKYIMEELGVKSESQVYTWWYWYKAGNIDRLSQTIGKQYTYGFGPEGHQSEETDNQKILRLKKQVMLLKKYEKIEREWYQKFL